MENVFSLKQYKPDIDVQAVTGIPREILEQTFGTNDILIQFETKEQAEQFLRSHPGDEKWISDKGLLDKVVNSIRDANNVQGVPPSARTEDMNAELSALLALQEKTAQERLMIEDPIRFKNKQWREKLEQDKRAWTTFLSGRGRGERETSGIPFAEDLDAAQGDPNTGYGKGLIGVAKDVVTFNTSVPEVLDYFGDSFMGLANTTMRLLPEFNKQNATIAGDFLSTLPLYFADRKKLLQGLLNPKQYPVAAAEVGTAAGIGAYTAAKAYDGLNAIYRELEGLPDPELSYDPGVEDLIHARNAIIFSGGAAALDPAFKMMKGLARWAYGVQKGTNAEQLAKLALEQKIPFGIANVTDRSWAKWYSRVVGVFPLVGSDIRASKSKVLWYADKRVRETLNELAPMHTVMKAGAILTDAAEAKFSQFARLNAALYDDFFIKARALDDQLGGEGYIPTFRITALAKDYIEQLGRGKIQLEYNPATGSRGTIGGFDDLSNFENFLLSLGSLPEYLNATQFRQLQKTFNQRWGEYVSKFDVKQADDIATQANHFKGALEQGFNDTNMWKVFMGQGGEPDPLIGKQMELLKTSLIRANKVFAWNANTYKSAFAKQFKNVDETMFIQGALPREGWIYDDQLAKYAFDSFYSNPSAMALEDLAKLVKRNKSDPRKDPINIAQNAYLTDLWQKSSDLVAYNTRTGGVETGKVDMSVRTGAPDTFAQQFNPKDIVSINVFNPMKFRQLMQLDTAQGQDFLLAMYKNTLDPSTGKVLGEEGARAAVDNMNRLLRIAEIGFNIKIGETSQFVARRAALAGFSGVSGAFLATGAGMSPLTGVGIALLAKHQGKILSNPKYLEQLVNTIDDTMEMKVRRANYAKLVRLIYDDKENEKIQGLDLDDPEAVMQYIFTNELRQSSEPEPSKTYEPNFPREDAPDKGPAQIEEEEFRKNMKYSNNMSNELITNPAPKFASKNVSNPFRPVGGSMSPAKRAALASGDLYQAIATAKKGGSINKQGIMYFAGRRRP